MFKAQMKTARREYTTTFAWLAMACVFIPAVTFVVRPGYLGLTLAGISGIACAVMAWISWNRSSRLTIPSIAEPQAGYHE